MISVQGGTGGGGFEIDAPRNDHSRGLIIALNPDSCAPEAHGGVIRAVEQLNSIATATELLARGTCKRPRCYGPRNPPVCEESARATGYYARFPTQGCCRTRASSNLKCNLSFPGVAPSFRRCPLSLGQPIESSFTTRFFSSSPLLSLSLSRFSIFRLPTGEFYSIESFPPTHEASPSSSYPGFDLIRFVGSRFHSTVTLIPFFFLSQLSTGRANYYTQLREIP